MCSNTAKQDKTCGACFARVAYGIWDPVAQFESDISNRGIFIKWKMAGSIPRRLSVQIRLPLLKYYIKEEKEMVLAVIRKQFKMIQNRIQFFENIKNWIIFGVLIRLRGLCIV